MKPKTLKYTLETFDGLGKAVTKTLRGEGWYIDDPETKQKGLCVMFPSAKKGLNQCIFISAEDLRAFVKSMPR